MANIGCPVPNPSSSDGVDALKRSLGSIHLEHTLELPFDDFEQSWQENEGSAKSIGWILGGNGGSFYRDLGLPCWSWSVEGLRTPLKGFIVSCSTHDSLLVGVYRGKRATQE